MNRTFAALTLGCVAALFPAAVAAQSAPPGGQCGIREKVMDHLANRYGETRHGIGIAANNTVMEVFASDTTGTWTITLTLPTGLTCLVASGQGFETLAEALPAKGDPA